MMDKLGLSVLLTVKLTILLSIFQPGSKIQDLKLYFLLGSTSIPQIINYLFIFIAFYIFLLGLLLKRFRPSSSQ